MGERLDVTLFETGHIQARAFHRRTKAHVLKKDADALCAEIERLTGVEFPRPTTNLRKNIHYLLGVVAEQQGIAIMRSIRAGRPTTHKGESR